MKNTLHVYISLFRKAPFSSIITILYFIVDAVYPAFTAVIFANLFDTVGRFLSGIGSSREPFYFVACYLVARFILDLFNYLFSVTVNTGIFEKGTMYFRIRLYEKLADMPLILFEDVEFLNKKQRAERAVNDEILPMVFYESLQIISAAAATFSVAVVLTKYSIWLLPLSLLSVLPFYITRLVRGKKFYQIRSMQAKGTRKLSYLWGLFTNKDSVKEMRTMGFDGYITDKWTETHDEVRDEMWKIERNDAVSLIFCNILCILGYVISLLVVLWLVLHGDVSIGLLGASMSAFSSMQSATRSFLIYLGQFPEKLSYASDYYTFLDITTDDNGTAIFPKFKEQITLKNVSFQYPNSHKYAVNNINLNVKKGEKVAIVGENGSGKTTLSKLILGMYPEQSGSILYDGERIAKFSKESFYDSVSAVAQDYVAYKLTLRENVALSDVSHMMCDSKITKALRYAGFDLSFCLDEPMGREFGGKELSGGQWQKVAIARGLFKNSDIIFFDEPTSALDPLMEAEVLSSFLKAAKDKTALLISHRVGLCKYVDRIVVMKNGKIVEVGPHKELLSAGGEYARLYTSQESWYKKVPMQLTKSAFSSHSEEPRQKSS